MLRQAQIYGYLRVFLAPGSFLARAIPSGSPAEGSVAPPCVGPCHRASSRLAREPKIPRSYTRIFRLAGALVELGPIWLTGKLAGVTTLVLLALGTPLAWWLAQTRARIKPAVEALTALPLVLPPTVLGFYMLILLHPGSAVGSLWVQATGDSLTFSFSGLVVASVVYSLPFMVQPLQTAFAAVGRAPLEAAASLRASPLDAFISVAVPLSARGFLTASVLTFAHTVGEFGVVLMVGGNIPDETRVVSIAIYEQVETLRYADAHVLSAGLLAFSFVVLLVVYSINRRFPVHAGLKLSNWTSRRRLGAFDLEATVALPLDGITAVFGPSGGGKTTLLRTIAGFECARGRIALRGEHWLDSSRRIDVPPHRRPVGCVFQDARLFGHLPVRGNLHYAARRAPPRRRESR